MKLHTLTIRVIILNTEACIQLSLSQFTLSQTLPLPPEVRLLGFLPEPKEALTFLLLEAGVSRAQNTLLTAPAHTPQPASPTGSLTAAPPGHSVSSGCLQVCLKRIFFPYDSSRLLYFS